MDKLLNVGKDLLVQQLSNQGGQGQGQAQSQSQGQSQGQNNQAGGFQDDVLKMAQQQASSNAGNSGSSDLFSNIMNAVGNRQDKIQNEDIDEQDAIKQHQQAYQNDAKGDSSNLGTAAALQALKMFTQSSNNTASSGTGQAAFLGMAMSEASKLFDSKAAQGKVADGASKESAVQQAAEMAMKMYFKSQAQSQGGLAGLAAKFL